MKKTKKDAAPKKQLNDQKLSQVKGGGNGIGHTIPVH